MGYAYSHFKGQKWNIERDKERKAIGYYLTCLKAFKATQYSHSHSLEHFVWQEVWNLDMCALN